MSRRDKIQMTDDERRAYIADKQTLVINTIGRDGVPHPMPMWFGIEEDDAIVMTTFTKSQKIKNIERDPRVSLLLESGTIYSELRGVVIYGNAELVRDIDDITEILVKVSLRSIDGSQDANADQIRQGVAVTAPKRTGIRVRADRILSWDHRKLGGVY